MKNEPAKATWESHRDIWECPQSGTVWADWITNLKLFLTRLHLENYALLLSKPVLHTFGCDAWVLYTLINLGILGCTYFVALCIWPGTWLCFMPHLRWLLWLDAEKCDMIKKETPPLKNQTTKKLLKKWFSHRLFSALRWNSCYCILLMGKTKTAKYCNVCQVGLIGRRIVEMFPLLYRFCFFFVSLIRKCLRLKYFGWD